MNKAGPRLSLRALRIIRAVAVLTLTAAAALLVIWGYLDFREQEQLVRQKREKIRSLEKDSRDLRDLIERYKAERLELKGLLFDDQDIATFLNTIGDFAKQAEVKILDMKAEEFDVIKTRDDTAKKSGAPARDKGQNDNKGPTLAFLPIRMVVEGSFDRLVDFLLSLQEYRQLLTVSNIGIRRQVFPTLSCRFVLRLYSLRQLEASAGP